MSRRLSAAPVTHRAAPADCGGVATEIDLAVLGPLVARRGDAAIALSRGQRSTLLAWFALHAGAWISVSATAELLWPGSTRDRGTARLTSLLSALRRELRPSPLPVVRRGDHLVVELPPESVDAHRLVTVVREATARSNTAPPERVARPVRQALAAWRSTPYPELGDHPDAVAARARLGVLRLDAVELLHGLRLVGMADPAVAADVATVTSTDPLRELSWRQLMAALEANGRHIEALRAFQACRKALAAAGSTPSAATLALERALLQRRPPAPELLLPDQPPTPTRARDGTSAGQSDTGMGAAERWLRDGGTHLAVVELAPGEQHDPSGAQVTAVVAPIEARGGRTLAVHAATGFAQLGQLLGVPEPTASRRWRAVAQVVRKLARAAARQPTVLVIHEAHQLPDAGELATVVDELLARDAPLLLVLVDLGGAPGVAHLRARVADLVAAPGR